MLSYSREQDRAGENMFNIKQFFLPSCVSSAMMDACKIYRNLPLDNCTAYPMYVRVNVFSYLMN